MSPLPTDEQRPSFMEEYTESDLPEIVPNRGFMIATDGTRIESVYKTLRACIGCGTLFYPPKTISRRIAETCSEGCRRHYAGRQISAARLVEAGEKAPQKPRPPRKKKDAPPSALVRDQYGRFLTKGAALPPPPIRVLDDVRRIPFGSAIEKRRVSMGLTHEEFATRFGLSKNTYRNWIAGKNIIPADKLAAFAAALGTTMEALWYDRD